MKICRECGTLCPDSTVFCTVCGTKFDVKSFSPDDDDTSMDYSSGELVNLEDNTSSESADLVQYSGILDTLLKRGYKALEDDDWEAADASFEDALKHDPECAEAYFGKAMVAAKANNKKAFVSGRLTKAYYSQSRKRIYHPSETIIEDKVKQYEIPFYFDADSIRKLYNVNIEYVLEKDDWIQKKAEEEKYWAEDSYISKARRFAKGNFKTELEKDYDELISFFDNQISEADQDGFDYNLLIGEIDIIANKEYELACSQREDDYQTNSELAYASEDATVLSLAEEALARLGDYKDSVKLVSICSSKIQAILEKDKAEQIRKQQEERYYQEQRLAEAKQNERNRKRRMRTVIVSSLLVCLVICAGVTIWFFTHRAAQKRRAYELAESYYTSVDGQAPQDSDSSNLYLAAVSFASAGDYSDAKERSAELWNQIVKHNTIATGTNQAIAIRNDGNVLLVDSNDPVEYDLSRWSDVVSVSASDGYTIGLLSDGTAVAFGRGANDNRNVSEWTDLVSVAAGYSHTAGLKNDGTVVVAGMSDDESNEISSWSNIISIGAGFHTVGLLADGTVVAVGANDSGQCDVSSWSGIKAIAVRGRRTVALRSDGTVIAQGQNQNGECDVSNWTHINSIAAGKTHTVGLLDDGTVVAVGSNDYGECDVSAWNDIIEIAAGDGNTLGLRSDGSIVFAGRFVSEQYDFSNWNNIKLP